MADGLIDLDAYPEESPTPRRRRPWRDGRSPLSVVVAGLALLTVTLVAGSAPLPRFGAASSVETAGAIRFGDGLVYLSTQRGDVRRLAAYDPGTGAVRWGVDYDNSVPVPVSDDPQSVLVVVRERSAEDGPVVSSVQARDAETGDLLWRHPGVTIVAASADSVALVSFDGGASQPAGAPASRAWAVSGVDRRTGRQTWRWTAPEGRFGLYPPRSVRNDDPYVVTFENGLLRFLDVTTGVAERTVPLASDAVPTSVVRQGGVAVVAYELAEEQSSPGGQPGGQPGGAAGTRVTAGYDIVSGERLWRRDGEDFVARPCGEGHLCARGGGGTSVIDARSGAELFRVPGGWTFARGPHLLVSGYPGDPDQPDGIAVFDLRTGRQVAFHHGWRLAADSASDRAIVTASAADGLLVGEIGPLGRDLTLLGIGYGLSQGADCRATARYLACIDPSRLSVWNGRTGRAFTSR